jgi:perosamine synthetase
MNNFSSIIKKFQKIYNNKKVYLHEPVFFGNEIKYLTEAIDSTFVSSVGPFVDRFEKDMANFNNIKRSVAVVNGTSALQVCLRLVGVEKDDEVLTQALTFVASSNSIKYLNADPVYIDVDLDTMGLSPQALESYLNEFGEIRKKGTYNKKSGKRIAACLPMHTFGFICRIDKIVEICKKWNIPVVEDAAEALGSEFKGKKSGSFGQISAFSFNGNKIITSGGGGAIVTNNKKLADRAKYLTTTARDSSNFEYIHNELGYNFRMPNINAALISAQLENIDKIIRNKKSLYLDYKSFLNDKGLNLVSIPKNVEWNYWLFSVQLENKKERDLFLKETNDNFVMTRPIWQLMYKLPMYKNCLRDNQKNAEFLVDRIVNIPSGAKL